MQCPRCVSLGVQDSVADVQVEGTLYCTPHGVEAWQQSQDPRLARRGPRQIPPFVPPPAPVVPSQ